MMVGKVVSASIVATIGAVAALQAPDAGSLAVIGAVAGGAFGVATWALRLVTALVDRKMNGGPPKGSTGGLTDLQAARLAEGFTETDRQSLDLLSKTDAEGRPLAFFPRSYVDDRFEVLQELMTGKFDRMIELQERTVELLKQSSE